MTERRERIIEAPPASEAPPVIHLPAPRSRRPGGRRRRALNPRTAKIELRATPARKAEIRAAAKAARMTMTDYIFAYLPGSAAPKPQPLFTADPETLLRMLAELGKWGSNLNQLARDRNTTGQGPEADELRRIRAAAWDMRNAVLKALGYAA